MRALLTSAAVAIMFVVIGAVGSKVEASMQGIGKPPLQTENRSGIEKVGYYRRHARRAYRRGYRRGYYGYGHGYGYRPYGYFGYGYRPYGYYGYGWRRPGISIYIGPGWGWGY